MLHRACLIRAYLERKPEAIVVRGYRNWLCGIVANDIGLCQQARHVHHAGLGSDHGEMALLALADLVDQLGQRIDCPLRYFRPDTGHLCRDECLLLGLVAGAQHGDDEVVHLCASSFARRGSEFPIAACAGVYGAVLKAAGEVLLPISTNAIHQITNRVSENVPDDCSMTVH